MSFIPFTKDLRDTLKKIVINAFEKHKVKFKNDRKDRHSFLSL